MCTILFNTSICEITQSTLPKLEHYLHQCDYTLSCDEVPIRDKIVNVSLFIILIGHTYEKISSATAF